MSDLIIINGDDEFLKERAAYEYTDGFLADEILKFDFPDDELKYTELSQCYLSDKRTAFLIRNSDRIPELPINNSLLIVLSKEDKKLNSKRATKTIDIQKLKYNKYKNDYIKWILDEGERRKINLNRVVGALFVNHGTCLRKLSSEIEKLSVVADHESQMISPEMAKSVMCSSIDFSPFLLIDLVFGGETKSVSAFVDKMKKSNSHASVIYPLLNKLVEIFQFDSDIKLNRDFLINEINFFKSIDLKLRKGNHSAFVDLELGLLRLSEEIKNVKSRNSGN